MNLLVSVQKEKNFSDCEGHLNCWRINMNALMCKLPDAQNPYGANLITIFSQSRFCICF